MAPDAAPQAPAILSHNTLCVITGLTNSIELNGRRCWIEEWLADSQRYRVVIGDADWRNVRPCNLRAPVAEDFVVPPVNLALMHPVRAGYMAFICVPDMLMFQSFWELTTDRPVITPWIMINRNTFIEEHGIDKVTDSALHLLQHGYPSPAFVRYRVM
eukprot:SAG31_NODE_998_length_10460_cov_255.143505_5_plen_158_part_00